jgi:hypothetical protein
MFDFLLVCNQESFDCASIYLFFILIYVLCVSCSLNCYRLINKSIHATTRFPHKGASVSVIHNFYSTMMELNWYLNILRYLHFTDNSNEQVKFDTISMIRDLFQIQNSIFYNPSENLADEDTIVSFNWEGDFQTVHMKEMQTFHYPSVQTIWLDWIHVWHKSILGEGQTEQGTACDSNKCEVTELVWKTHACGHKLHKHYFFSCPLTIWYRNRFTVAVLSRQTEEACHKPKHWRQQKWKGRHSSNMDHGWLDGNIVIGLGRQMHADEY